MKTMMFTKTLNTKPYEEGWRNFGLTEWRSLLMKPLLSPNFSVTPGLDLLGKTLDVVLAWHLKEGSPTTQLGMRLLILLSS